MLVCKMNEEEEETKKQTIQHNEVRPSCLLFHHTIHTASSRDSFNGTIITADRPTDRPNDSMTCIAVIPFLLHRKPLLAMFMLKQEFFGLFLLCIVKCTPPNLPSSYQFEATVSTTWTGKSPIVRSAQACVNTVSGTTTYFLNYTEASSPSWDVFSVLKGSSLVQQSLFSKYFRIYFSHRFSNSCSNFFPSILSSLVTSVRIFFQVFIDTLFSSF